jgi:hypothetical protein
MAYTSSWSIWRWIRCTFISPYSALLSASYHIQIVQYNVGFEYRLCFNRILEFTPWACLWDAVSDPWECPPSGGPSLRSPTSVLRENHNSIHRKIMYIEENPSRQKRKCKKVHGQPLHIFLYFALFLLFVCLQTSLYVTIANDYENYGTFLYFIHSSMNYKSETKSKIILKFV